MTGPTTGSPTGVPTEVPAQLAAVHDATTRYLQHLDTLTPEQLSEPSVLPGWTRAHVVAHLANHAQGTARALTGLVQGERLPVYDSQEQRDAAIDEVAAMDARDLRELSFASCDRWREAVEAVERAGDWTTLMERTPGGPGFDAAECVRMRWREVEIHHADLASGYTAAHWSPEFASYLLDLVAEQRGVEHDLTLRTPTRTVTVGRGGPVVEGSEHDLGWWLVGRGRGEGLTGDVPRLGPWR